MLPSDLAARIARRLTTQATRMKFRLGLRTLRPGAVRLSSRFQHPIDASRRPQLLARYRELFPAGAEAELQEARRLLQHRFTFLGHSMDHGERIAWSRDPVSGRDWSQAFSADIPYRGPRRLGDIKLPWELNKHQYFFTLGKAAWLSDDEAFSREIRAQIDAWIADNPPHAGIHWVSALESGTRALSWMLSYPFFDAGSDATFRQRLMQSLGEHMLFVERNLSTDRFANTHLAGEAAILAVGGLFLESAHSARWLETGLRHLCEQMQHQCLPDGVHAEQSIAYHRFFLDQYYLVDALLRANGRSLPADVLTKMEQMTGFLLDALHADGTVPAFGDCDDARGIWCRADAPRDFRALLALGAVTFNRPDFKHAAAGPAEELLWLYGEAGISTFLRMRVETPTHVSAAYPHAGYYVMRGGWNAGDPVVMFDCGPLGHGSAGHGHADALSFQLHSDNYTFLTDPGTYAYNLDYQWRDAFRSTRAHNTFTVDGQDQSVMQDRMSWNTAARTRCLGWTSNAEVDLVDAEHDGYRRLEDPVTHRRVVAFLKPDVWLVVDRFSAVDAGRVHTLEMTLHLRPDCRVEHAGTHRVTLASPAGKRLHLDIDEQLTVQTLDDGWFSDMYGVKMPAPAVRVAATFTGGATLVTTLATTADAHIETRRNGEQVDIIVTRKDSAPVILRDVMGRNRTVSNT